MTAPAPDPLPELPLAARAAIDTVLAAPTAPVKLLVSGGIGTGKSATLAGIRSAFREAGRVVLTRAPRPGDTPQAAFVVDDAHLLGDNEIDSLAELVADPSATVVVAGEPLTHRLPLHTLATTLERENPVVRLGPLAATEVSRVLSTEPGVPATPETVRSVLAATAGLPFLLQAAAGAVDAPADAARFALLQRLRLIDEDTRDALLILSLSHDLGPDDVAAALRLTGAEASALVDRARAGGLVEPSHDRRFLRMVHDSLAQIAGAARHHEIETSLLASQLELSTLSADLAVRLAEHGLRDDRLAEALAEHAAHNRARPARAARLYRAAVMAGAAAVSTRLADALALAGDCTTAARMADELLSSQDPAERATAVRIAASIAMHDGSAAQAADLFRWLGPYPDPAVSSAATIAQIAAGDGDAARASSGSEVAGPPTSTARAARSLAEGLVLSLDQPFAVTVARLNHAVTGYQAGGVAPDTPAALVTLAALHGGDSVRARSVISRAVRAGGADGTGDEAFSAARHRLLLGWVKMQDGQLGAAGADATAAESGGDLHRRDALWAAALRTAIARRSGDSGAVQKYWYAAMEVLAEYSIDVFSLLPLGELWVAGARMRQVDRLEHTLAEAFGLLDALGNPVLWSVPLRWAGVHAGILANSPGAVAPHGQALTAAAGHSAFARALANAGRTWLRVLANHVDTDEVTASARALSQFGLTWDGTRLASQAALQTPDARVSQAMLQLARDLKQTSTVEEALPDQGASVTPVGAATQASPAPSSTKLSDREREVAELLLLGMPYRDIGSQLFISAKTVEHHVARIRRRLGAESRTEMLSMLRAMLAPQM
ncbi:MULTISPECIES: isoniazid response ATPase/transcriptional regulator IniR [unclassified Mycolicibacterium]|uniref:isoniazid response ATPase/transcriptional regulator IniR n=1 Tax=unclassified Mycolicibacterium TaxID=2636767 RepID=UPI0012DC6270|nr:MULTISPECIES: isoniazid response ATPase/transcriptional regulator IniR [unclassified Mycolicibacterium]MUL82050.1 helix-turn-helix transcriptional regulator [Mycolicibacterium sp. CBMA 329]MUL87816.1 helix-turn-helix transcriptional regulator [Mycolicibacterium sp. CBMA 331]MUM01640.1 helix-turn-helix transcriptional regulator [Mycolicibacterium sp. CBMA 334]MUM25527.1 helix-turn-helix transcriptional regulator [Mycolicibacterium sp. CBMA 295]MUM38113.1 helix-turn-helix transcriptional regu